MTGCHPIQFADRISAGGRCLRAAQILFDPPSAAAGPAQAPEVPSGTLTEAVDALEGRMIDHALARSQGDKTQVAVLLGISERMRKWGHP